MTSNIDTVYETLPTETSTRLLWINPVLKDDSEIDCHMMVVPSLEHLQAISYDALSYEWGDSDDTVKIRCDGRLVDVTRKLASALKRFRPLPENTTSTQTSSLDDGLATKENAWAGIAIRNCERSLKDRTIRRPIWIDALCVNQQDENEKTRQVSMMRQIFESADTVIAWLGEGGPDTTITLSLVAQALENLEDERRLCRSKWQGIEEETYDVWTNLRRGFPNLVPNGSYSDHHHWKGLGRFCDIPYFLRVWIIQEVVVAKKVKVVRGDFEIAMDALGAAASWFVKKGYVAKVPALAGLQNIAFLWNRNRLYKRSGKKRAPLMDLLRDTRSYNATRSVDRIFALLGLAEEGSSDHCEGGEFIPVDYTKPEQDVFKETTRFLVRRYNTLEPLTVVNHKSLHHVFNRKQLSWTPQWNSPTTLFDPSLRYFAKRSNCSATEVYQAGGSTTVDIDEHAPKDAFIFRGIEVDRVAYCSSKLRFDGEDATETFAIRQFWKHFQKKTNQSKDYAYTRESILEAFHLTCVAADTPSGSPESKGQATHIARFYQLDVPTPTRFGYFYDGFPFFMKSKCSDCRLFFTEKGYLGVGPNALEVNDIVVIPFGGQFPLVLRPKEDSAAFYLVGNTYVHGIMTGDFCDRVVQKESVRSQYFELC